MPPPRDPESPRERRPRARAGPPDEASVTGCLDGNFGAHSLRSRFITEAGDQLVPLVEGMKLSGHKNVTTALKYYQTGETQNSRTANPLGDESGD